MNVSKILGLILFVFALPLLHASNDSNVWWVDDDNYGKTGLDGMSPETAFGTIQEAIDAETTSSGDTIKVLPGTYNQEYREIKDGDGNVLERNRIVIDKKLNIVAVGTKEETHIVGRHCPESEGGAADYGTGPTAVRCVRVAESGLGSMLSGFTIRDSATIDSTVTGAEDCGGSVSVENAAKDFFVTDCVISNSVCLRYGGTSYGGTFIRCLISDSRASNYSSALFSGNALFCVMAHCRLVNGSRNYYSLDNGDGSIVNCTIYGSTAARPSANGNYNCLFLGNNRSEINDAAEASNNVYASHGAAYRNADPVQLFAPALGDFRPLPGSDVFGAGAAKYLTTECPISLPEGFELLDMDGKKVDVSGEHVAAGAYQYPKTPKFGGVLLTADSTINGFPTYGTNQFYASAWPMQVKVSVVRFMHVSGYSDESEFSTRWPGKDGYVTITPPYAAGVVQTNTAASNANSRYVDAVNGNDTNNGAKDTPCATLQKVIDNYGSSGNPVVIYLAEGDYCIGGAEGRGVTNRFNLTNARWVKIITTGDRSKTIIRGAAAKNERDPVNYPGCGPDAVRCVNFSYNNSRYNHSVAFVGVTFADGHTDVGQNESYDMGGGVYGRPGKPGCLQFIDCVFTNCYAPAAGVGAQANFVRCRFIDCGGVTDGFRGSLLSSSLVEGGDFGTGALGSNTRAVGCTIASANAVAADASGLFVLNSIVSEGTKFPASAAIWGTTAYPCFADPVNGDYRPVSGSPALDVARRIFPKTDDPGWDDFTRYVSYLSTDDINRNKWICSGAYPIAGAYMDWVQGVSLFGEGCEWLTVSGASVGGNQLQPESKVTISRNPDAIRHWGVVVNGVTNYLDSGSAECVVGNGMNEGSIMPVLDQNWYVNPDPSIGDDGNNGFTPSTPKLTLNGALSVATNAGDVVHAAAGTYASGEIEYDYEAYTNKYNDVSFGSDPVRCEIAAGVRLVGDAGAEATILDGSGTHRGVLLNPGAVIQGFTIQNCKINGYGGAVHGVNDDDAVADCIVEDNVSGRFSIYMVKGVFRSRFYRNSADYGPVGSKVCLYNCLIGEGNKGRYCMFQNGTLDNCTVLGKLPASRKGIYFRNCLVVPTGQGSGDKCSWWNSSYIGMQNGADNFHEGNEQVPADEMQFVDTVGGIPVIGKNCGVDRGDESLYFANYPTRLDPLPNGVNCDLLGNPRVSNGTIDRGCVEADWCGEYATTLGGGSSFAVYSASSNVTNANGFVVLPNGGELTAVWRVPAGMTASCSFSFRNTGAGTLYVTVNGETVAYGPSEETRAVRFCCTSAADTVALKYEAGEDTEGCAEIFGFAGYRGLRLTIR